MSENRTPKPTAKVAWRRGLRRCASAPRHGDSPWTRPVNRRSAGSQACRRKAEARPMSPMATKAHGQCQRDTISPVVMRPVKPPMTVPVT